MDDNRKEGLELKREKIDKFVSDLVNPCSFDTNRDKDELWKQLFLEWPGVADSLIELYVNTRENISDYHVKTIQDMIDCMVDLFDDSKKKVVEKE